MIYIIIVSLIMIIAASIISIYIGIKVTVLTILSAITLYAIWVYLTRERTIDKEYARKVDGGISTEELKRQLISYYKDGYLITEKIKGFTLTKKQKKSF